MLHRRKIELLNNGIPKIIDEYRQAHLAWGEKILALFAILGRKGRYRQGERRLN